MRPFANRLALGFGSDGPSCRESRSPLRGRPLGSVGLDRRKFYVMDAGQV
jgi:hypothetical protein